MQPLARKVALCRTPSVLLVDDREPELLEAQRRPGRARGADDELDGARFDLRELLAARDGRGRSGQQRHAEARRLQQLHDVHEMLLGEDLRSAP